jgi:D-lyxose ketol-isomerase
MKRSEINSIIEDAKAFLAEKQFCLPPWAYWRIDDWKKNKENACQIASTMLGWDITDFGSGDFYSRGLFLFTLRNGKVNIDKKNYAEKIMIVGENQETPMHFHWNKMEDIINRGGGNLVIEVYNSDQEGNLSVNKVDITIDGINRRVSAGGKVILTPGESICLEPGVYHRFYGESSGGKVLVGEVSMVNDDNSDNHFYEQIGRFPQIIENEDPVHLLVNDYKKFI